MEDYLNRLGYQLKQNWGFKKVDCLSRLDQGVFRFYDERGAVHIYDTEDEQVRDYSKRQHYPVDLLLALHKYYMERIEHSEYLAIKERMLQPVEISIEGDLRMWVPQWWVEKQAAEYCWTFEDFIDHYTLDDTQGWLELAVEEGVVLPSPIRVA